jgi:hypothetical protein
MLPTLQRSLIFAASCLALLGCQDEHKQQTREVVEQGVEQAKQGVEQGVEQAKQGVEQAKQGIAEARERYDVDERVDEARARFNAGMDEAADSFAELADASRDTAKDIGAAIDEQTRIEGSAEGIACKPDPTDEAATRCTIDAELLTKLQAEPKLLARQVILLPKQGATGRGLELVRLGRESVPELIGLRANDILLELNGTALSSLDAIRQVDEALAGKPNAELVYEREKQRKTLVLEPRVAP